VDDSISFQLFGNEFYLTWKNLSHYLGFGTRLPISLKQTICLLCLWACLSALLVHPMGGRPGGIRVVTSYTGVVLGYAGSFRYDHAPRCCRGRRQVVTALSVRYGSFAVVSEVAHDRVWCRSCERCNRTRCTPVHDILPGITSLSSEP
jgi:hypothetical protein